jgi:glycosyltransferase involved in cell wall biosynthesis
MPLGGAIYRAVRGRLGRRGRYVVDGVAAALTGRPNLLRHIDLALGLLRRRLAPRELFIGWVLNADEDGGGARVHGLMPHAYLRHRDMNSVVLRKPRQHYAPLRLHPDDVDRLIDAGFDVVVFPKVADEGAQMLAKRLSAAGTRTVYVAGDLWGHDMAQVVDWVVAASEGLAGIVAGRHARVSVIEPVIDAPRGLVKHYARRPATDRIRVVWVGYPENLHLVEVVREALRDPRLAGYELVTISRGPDVTYQWHRTRVFEQILDCDIAVLPLDDTPWYQAKPNTRLTMFKALGLPIVASPIDSYRRTLAGGRGCYFASTPAEWVDALLALGDAERRREVGLADREQVLAAYSLEAMGEKWLALLRALAASGATTRQKRGDPHLDGRKVRCGQDQAERADR